MPLRVGGNALSDVKYGATAINRIKLGTITVWTSNAMRDPFDRQDSLGLGSGWTDHGPGGTPYLASVFGRACRINMPEEEPGTVVFQESRQRFTTATATTDDGWIETRILNTGVEKTDSTFSSFVLHRVNSTFTNGVGIGAWGESLSIAALIGGTFSFPLGAGIGKLPYIPGDIVRLTSTGNMHTLMCAGTDLLTWNDSGGTVAKGASYRHMGLSVNGLISPVKIQRILSPTLDYIERGDAV